MSRLFRGEDLERTRARNRAFDPVEEGQRFGLAPEVSLAIWELVRRELGEQPDEDRARRRFRELAARFAARGGRLDLDVGRVTRADIELHGAPRPARRLDLRHRAPGRTTRVAEQWQPQDSAAPELAESADLAAAARELPGASDVASAMAALQAMAANRTAHEAPKQIDETDLQAEHTQAREAQPTAEPEAPALEKERLASEAQPAVEAEAAALEKAHLASEAQPAVEVEAAALETKPTVEATAGAEATAPETKPTAEVEATAPEAQPAAEVEERPAADGEKQQRWRWPVEGGVKFDAAELVERVRQSARREELPFQAELEDHFGQSLEFVETFTGEVAAMACAALSATAFAVRNVVVLGDANPGRDVLMHELTHVIQTGGAGARAPRRFESGSLEVGPEDSAVEREAYMAHASQPAEHASPHVIHRATKKKPAADPKDRVADFVEIALQRDPIQRFTDRKARPDTRFGVLEGGWYPIRYLQSQRDGFTSAQYEQASGGKESELQQVITDGGAVPKGKGLRLHRVGPGKKRWLITRSTAAEYRATATALDPPQRFKTAYLGDGTRGMTAIPKVAEKLRWGLKGATTLEAWDPAVTDDEFSAYRDAIEKTIAAHYKGQPGGKKWLAFYEEVVLGPLKTHPKSGQTVQTGIFPHPYKRIVGNVFEKLVEACVSDAGQYKITSTQVAIYKKGKKGPALLAAIADGKLELKNGKLIVGEAKAWTQRPGKVEREQAERYNDMVEGVTSYGLKNGDAFIQRDFDHVVYYFSSPDVAELWKPMLDNAFGHDPTSKDYTKSRYSVVPPYPGHKKSNFRVKYNPEFEIPVQAGKHHVHLHPPPIKHAGLKVTDLDVTLDDTGAVKSGSITAGIDIANGILKVAPKREPLTVGRDGEAVAKNSFPNIGGKLDRILGDRLKPTAVLNEDGVTASLDITPGKSGIPGFELTAGRVSVSYSNDGALVATGTIGLSRKVGKGTIGGEVTVAYSGKGFTVDGDIDVTAGVVEGLDGFKAGFTYEGGDVIIRADRASYTKTIGGVTLTGNARALSYDTRTKQFSGEAQIDAELGPFGTATASATIEHNKLARARFTYDSPELVYPKGGTTPVFTGTVGGTIKYEDGHLSGDIRGDARLAIAGLKAMSEDGEIALGVHARIDHDGKFSGAIENKTGLQFGKHFRIPRLQAKLTEEGEAVADFDVQLTGIKNVPDARMSARIDSGGFHLTGGTLTLKLGDETDRMWGSVTASYQEGEGLVVAGKVSVRIKDGMIGTGELVYSTKKGEADALVKVERIPLLDVKQRAKKLVEFEKQIVVFSFFGITLFLDTRFTLEFLYGLQLGMTPSVEVKGIDLEHLKFRQAIATIDVDGDLSAALVASPGVGLGLALFHPDLLSGHAGLKMPITAGAHLLPKTTLQATYDSEGGLQAGASLGLALNFGITGAVTAYAGLNVLLGAWQPSWEKQLTSFTIMEPRELFNWTLDLGAPIKKHEPALDDGGVAPKARPPVGPQPIKQTELQGKPPEQPAPAGAKGSDNGMAAISQFLPQLRTIPEYQDLEAIIQEAIELWDKFKGVVSAIKNAVKEGLVAIKNGASFVGRNVWEGVKWVGGKVAWVGGKIADAAESVWDHTGGAAIDAIGSLF